MDRRLAEALDDLIAREAGVYGFGLKAEGDTETLVMVAGLEDGSVVKYPPVVLHRDPWRERSVR